MLAELEPLLRPGERVLDLGCGCGVPVAQRLARTCDVTGVDISEVQIARARELVPAAHFLCVDMAALNFPEGSFEAIVSFFAVIHVPLDEQWPLFQRLAGWLTAGGHLLATVGHRAWTGTEEDWHGGTMYWSHADRETSRDWLERLGLEVIAERYLPEGDGGHSAFLARKPA